MQSVRPIRWMDGSIHPIRWMDGWTKQKVKMPDPVQSDGWTDGQKSQEGQCKLREEGEEEEGQRQLVYAHHSERSDVLGDGGRD